MPIILHCSSGISRSGAIGSILNGYCNSSAICSNGVNIAVLKTM